MPIQQKLPPPVLLFSDFAGWELAKIKTLELINSSQNTHDRHVFFKSNPTFGIVGKLLKLLFFICITTQCLI